MCDARQRAAPTTSAAACAGQLPCTRMAGTAPSVPAAAAAAATATATASASATGARDQAGCTPAARCAQRRGRGTHLSDGQCGQWEEVWGSLFRPCRRRRRCCPHVVTVRAGSGKRWGGVPFFVLQTLSSLPSSRRRCVECDSTLADGWQAGSFLRSVSANLSQWMALCFVRGRESRLTTPFLRQLGAPRDSGAAEEEWSVRCRDCPHWTGRIAHRGPHGALVEWHRRRQRAAHHTHW